MRVQFQWTQRDWTEAVALANQRGTKHKSSVPGLTWALIGIPLIGGAGELVRDIRSSSTSRVDVLLPILMVLLAGVVGLIFTIAKRQRLYRMLQQAAMPAGDCEAVLQESGWFVRESDSITAANPSLRSWSELRETRRGRRVLVFLQSDSFEALPLSSLTEDQDGHLRRLLTRKLRQPVL